MKSILAVSTVVMIAIASIFTQADLNVSFNIPEKISAGESFVLEMKVDKGDIANFSKLQLTLPEGFSAELLDGKGGTFTFYDQKMKLIWIALPDEPIFTVKVKVTTTPEIAGTFNFSGKISYIVDSERKEKPLVSPNFLVDPNAAPTANTAQENNEGTTTSTALKPSENNEASEFKCNRSFDANAIAPGQTFLVILSVQKKGISGLGKIIDNLPPGFTASEVSSNGAIFSSTGNQVKFLWMTLPAEEAFQVSYKVKVDETVTGNKVIDGKVSFLEGDETKTILVEGTGIEVTNNPSDTPDPITPVEPADTDPEPIEPVEPKDPEPTATADPDPVDPIEPQDPDPVDPIEAQTTNHSVNYRVQICALRKQVNTNYFTKHHNIQEHIYANMHQGWHKYTVGDFGLYKGARDHREVIRNQHKIVGPFVTAYNNGTRITVQEALMITKDQWMP